MEIATTVSPSSQMPLASAEIIPADETGAVQGKMIRSSGFGLLFDQWAGMAGGERLPADSPVSVPEKGAVPASAPAPGECDLQETPTLQTLPGLQQKFGKTGNTGAITADTRGKLRGDGGRKMQTPPQYPAPVETPGGLPIPEAKEAHSAGSPPAEQQAKAGREEEGTYAVWAPLFAAGSIPSAGNSAASPATSAGPLRQRGNALAEKSAGRSALQPADLLQAAAGGTAGLLIQFPPASIRTKAADSVPAPVTRLQASIPQGTGSYPGTLSGIGTSSENAGKVTGSAMETGGGSVLPEEKGENRASRDILLSRSKGIDGEAMEISSQGTDESPQKTAPAAGIIPGNELSSGTVDKATADTTKTGVDAAIPEAKGDIRTGGDIPFSPTKGIDNEAVDIFRPGTDLPFGEAAQAGRMRSPMSSASAGNAYRAAADATLSGRNDASSVPGNITQGKSPAIPVSTAVAAGIDPSRMEVVFAAEGRENPKKAGSTDTGKSAEAKTADNSSAISFTANQAELRPPGESRPAALTPDTRNPLGEHITNQVRERLAAGGADSDNGQITLKLHPDDLGELKINMRMEDQHLKVEITTQNPSVKEALMQNLDTLKETLSRQNIAMDRFSVSADIRQGLQQGEGDGRRMTQENRLINSGFRQAAAIEEDAAADLQYRWENENSLVNLVL